MSRKLSNPSNATFIQAAESYCIMFLENGNKNVKTRPMKFFEEALKNYGWCRIHRSFMVNPLFIKQISEGQDSIFLQDGTILPISRRNRKSVLRWRNTTI